MSNKDGQMHILKDIFMENFEAKETGMRGSSTLFEITSIVGTTIPEGITLLVNFDDIGKIRWVGEAIPFYMPNCSKEIDDMQFMGNLNVFVMKKKKVLKRVHVSFDGEAFKMKKNTYSLKAILHSVMNDNVI